MSAREQLKHQRRWVVKVGSAVLTENGLTLSKRVIQRLSDQIAKLRQHDIEIVLVSSGSIAAGIGELEMQARPERLNELQAAAAVGQAALVQTYDEAFAQHKVKIAQVLLTHADIANRERYLNARNTLQSLLNLNVLTIVNENDTVATDEICFGDNDNLGALVANLVGADLLVLLTDQDGLYDSDPRTNAGAKLISQGVAGDPQLDDMAGTGSSLGRGGMITKLAAAKKAAHSGCATIIANGQLEDVLLDLYKGDDLGTCLTASGRFNSRKQWMAGQMRCDGVVHLDSGAATVIQQEGRSVLPIGVTQIENEFERGALVSCVDPNGVEIARGLSNYSSADAVKLQGLHGREFAKILGFRGDHELIHRDNLVLLNLPTNKSKP